jgi:decaprenylphospho-beta-D-ribofuranose 2-oxidase
MLSAELGVAEPALGLEQPLPRRTTVHGWGSGPGAEVDLVSPTTTAGLQAALGLARPGGGVLPRGMGRSYGDAAQLRDGLILQTTRLKSIDLDPEPGVATVGAGVTIAELLQVSVPAGWMVPVVPGTQHVSVGGAIASDIHGKNHGVAGTFGQHVEGLELLSASGELHWLEPGQPERRFEATVGGMGLTGTIVCARIRLRPVSSPLLSVDTDRVDSLEAALEVLAAPGGPHRVAWLDLLGSSLARGVVTRAEHLDAGSVPAGQAGQATVKARATVPVRWPAGPLRPASIRAFNELRFRLAPRSARGQLESIGSHMFPLDALQAWPRLYGPAGLLQYQLVLPYGQEAVLETVLTRLRRARLPSFLAVLKDFGPANDAPLSFPLAGWTLALDFPRLASGLDAELAALDQLIAGAGGRVYLTKDARMAPDALQAMYPRLEEWRDIRDGMDPEGMWRSDLALRTGLLRSDARGVCLASAAATPSPRAATARPASLAANRPGPVGSPATERRVLVLGGTSEIGLAIVRRMAAEGPLRPYLLGRSLQRLRAALGELESAGCLPGEVDVLDARELDTHAPVLARAFDRMGAFDVVLLAVGVLGGQAGVSAETAELREVLDTNFLGAGSLLLEAVRRLREQPAEPPPTLIVLSSVAAERPRASNAVYGAAKAGLDSLAQGIGDAVHDEGVRVLVVRPGFVTTRMTAGLEAAPMSTTPEAVAEATVRALGSGTHTVWVPSRLRLVFAVLRHLPRTVFRRLPI